MAEARASAAPPVAPRRQGIVAADERESASGGRLDARRRAAAGPTSGFPEAVARRSDAQDLRHQTDLQARASTAPSAARRLQQRAGTKPAPPVGRGSRMIEWRPTGRVPNPA